MKTLLVALIVVVFFGFLVKANAYQVLDTVNEEKIEQNLYFYKFMEDQSSFDNDFRHKKPMVRIKIVLTCDTYASWCNDVEKKLIHEASEAGWTRGDYLDYLDWKFWKLYSRSNDAMQEISKDVLRKLKKLKRRTGKKFLDDAFYEEGVRNMISLKIRRERGRDYSNNLLEVLEKAMPTVAVYSDAVIRVFGEEGVETKYSFGGEEKSLYYKSGGVSNHFKRLFQKGERRLENLGLR